MPRPKIKRCIKGNPDVTYFKPAGVPMRELEDIRLDHDEFEAIRLKDSLKYHQSKAAEKMKISQPTFHRLLLSAREKIADAITKGKAIRIDTK